MYLLRRCATELLNSCGTYFAKIINLILRTDAQIFVKNCLSGQGFIRNKTSFETAVRQLILVHIALSPDGMPSGNHPDLRNLWKAKSSIL